MGRAIIRQLSQLDQTDKRRIAQLATGRLDLPPGWSDHDTAAYIDLLLKAYEARQLPLPGRRRALEIQEILQGLSHESTS
jgi:hypothetical protein